MIEHAILLSAGQGSRMLPLTAEQPKCMIGFSGRTLIEWQIEMLARGGVKRIDVVTGFMTDLVDEHLKSIRDPRVTITPRFNPFYKVADNLGSCWIARDVMDGDFLILNGDTLVSEDVVRRVQQGGVRQDGVRQDGAGTPWPITVTVDIKDSYDSDDMKVERGDDGRSDRLVHIGKTLTSEQTHAESIGFLAFRGEGAGLFRDAVRAAMRTPEGVQHWYLKVIDSLASTGKVGTLSIADLGAGPPARPHWAEVDFLNDIEVATLLTDSWVG